MASGSHVRWLIRRDMPTVLQIEQDAFPEPWSEGDFIRALRQPEVIGMVTEEADVVTGYIIYELHKKKLVVLNLAVALDHRRRRAGTALIQKLQSKLSFERRNRLEMAVRETNLPAQLFLKSAGFRAVDILKNYWSGCDEDAYMMQYRWSENTASELMRNQ